MGVRAFVRVCLLRLLRAGLQSSRVKQMGNRTVANFSLPFFSSFSMLFLSFSLHLFNSPFRTFFLSASLCVSRGMIMREHSLRFEFRVVESVLEARESSVERCWKNVNSSLWNFESSVLSNW